MDAKGVTSAQNNCKVTKTSTNYKNKKFAFLLIFKKLFTRFLLLKDFNLMQGHVLWMLIFQQYILKGKNFPMGLQNKVDAKQIKKEQIDKAKNNVR